ncbi:TadE/TadG family type IV pilus assembly protein [Salinarimonas chemoclinalis]|uniref:TadE/TadG family type IV pilus assembly protein n=1 Tax=Salinarimonas chemoclinalis TaxID=3241599 RepID=UPI003558B996
MRRFLYDTRGSAVIPLALVLVPVIGLAGAAVDYTRTTSVRAEIQSTLDAAVIAGARAPQDHAAVAERAFDTTRIAGVEGVDARFSLGEGGRVVGEVGFSVPTVFLGVVGRRSFDAEVRAEAVRASAPNGPCVLVLDERTPQPFLVNSGADVHAPDCEIHVRSRANPAAILNAGAEVSVRRLCVAGRDIIDNGATVSGLELGCAAAEDPYAGSLPVPQVGACDYSNGNYNGGNVTLSPGVYCGWHNFNGAPRVTLEPGLYVVKDGGWNVNGGVWRGEGVTFYFPSTAKIQFNSGMDVALSAPEGGETAGILLFEAPGLPRSQFILNNANGNTLEGLVYLPSRELVMNARSRIESDRIGMVVDRLILNVADWRLAPENAGASAGAEVRLVR